MKKEEGLEIVTRFRQLAYQEQRLGRPINKVELEDLTPEFIGWINAKLRYKELITITIRGQPTSGKSTVGLQIKYIINRLLVQLGKRNTPVDEYKTIFSDQLEFNRFVTTGGTNMCILVDEYNSMAEGGANSTTEEQVFRYYAEVFAQQYVHRILCTPGTGYDKNSEIILDVIGKDDEKGITVCHVVYNAPSQNMHQIIGHIKIDVKEVLKQEWYPRYRKKKEKRWTLLQTHGQADIRKLEFADIALKTFKECEPLSEVMDISHGYVTAMVSKVSAREKKIYSMFSLAEISNKAQILVDIKKEMRKPEGILARPKAEAATRANALKALEILKKEFTTAVQEEEKNVKIYQEYLNIE